VTTATSPALSTQTYRERPVAAPIAGLASCVWVQRVSPDGPAYAHRTVPNGSIDVAWVHGSDVVSVVGPRREPFVARLAPGSVVVGVRLRPGVAAEVLGASAPELVGQTIALDQVWGRSAATVVERMSLAATPDDAARALEAEIVARSMAAPEPDAVVAETVRRLQPGRSGEIGALASELFISPRQLRRRCIAAFGFGPKTLHRLLRFQGFLALVQSSRHDAGLGWLAAAAGYFDQAHLTRESVALAGLTPGALLAETRANCGPNHDHAVSFAPARRALMASPAQLAPGPQR
jgi:AraC-like DNA-binding protein